MFSRLLDVAVIMHFKSGFDSFLSLNDPAVKALALSFIRIELTSREHTRLLKSAGDFSKKAILLKEKTAFEHMQGTECACV